MRRYRAVRGSTALSHARTDASVVSHCPGRLTAHPGGCLGSEFLLVY
jgi:hypothetical protein